MRALEKLFLTASLWALAAGHARGAIPDGVHPDFELKEIRLPERYMTMGLGFLGDGTLVLATIATIGGGEIPAADPASRILLIKGASTDSLPASVKVVADSWHQIAGITVVEDQVYVSDRDGFYRIADLSDSSHPADNRERIVKWPDEDHWNTGVSWHQWVFTPLYWKGSFYAPYSGSIRPGGWSNVDPTTALSGAFLKWDLGGTLSAYAGGLRSPNGANLDPGTGEMFVTDNQGSWLPSSTFLRIRPGRFYGHKQSTPDVDSLGNLMGTHPPNFAESLPYDPPIAWLPYGSVRSSPSQPVQMPKGLYAGDWLIGDVNSPGLVRVALDRVGEECNGAVFWFSKGMASAAVNRMAWDAQGGLVIGTITQISGNWPNGPAAPLYRLAPKPSPSAFDLGAVRSVADGLELIFTQPVDPDSIWSGHFNVKQWQYVRMKEYGQGKQADVPLSVTAVEMSQDRKRVHLKIDSLKEDRVVYLQLSGVKSSGGKALWNDESWFTLNAQSARAFDPAVDPVRGAESPRSRAALSIRPAGPGILDVTLAGGACEVELAALDGTSASRVRAPAGTARIVRPRSAPGIFVVTARRGEEIFSRHIFF